MTTVLATTPTSGGAPVLHRLSIQPLTAEAFARFGDVIESAGHTPIQINHGMIERYHALAHVDTGGAEGHALARRGAPTALPV